MRGSPSESQGRLRCKRPWRGSPTSSTGDLVQEYVASAWSRSNSLPWRCAFANDNCPEEREGVGCARLLDRSQQLTFPVAEPYTNDQPQGSPGIHGDVLHDLFTAKSHAGAAPDTPSRPNRLIRAVNTPCLSLFGQRNVNDSKVTMCTLTTRHSARG